MTAVPEYRDWLLRQAGLDTPDRERVGAEMVRHLIGDGGPVEYRVDIIDRDRAETIVSLRVGQALNVRAQLDQAIREVLDQRIQAGRARREARPDPGDPGS